LPIFWFPDNEKFPFDVDGDLTDEITAGGRYKVQQLYDDRVKPSGSELVQAQQVVVTVNENAIKAGNAKNAPMNAIKNQFISFHQTQGGNYPDMTASARRFYFNLNETNKQLFAGKEAAIRTLRTALSNHIKEEKPSE
jgi:hypothetical protein